VTAEPEVVPAVRGVARVESLSAPRVRAIAHVDSPVVRDAAPVRGRSRSAASVPWSPVVEHQPPDSGSGLARGVAMVPDPSPSWRVRASVPPIVVARRAVAPGPTVVLDRAAVEVVVVAGPPPAPDAGEVVAPPPAPDAGEVLAPPPAPDAGDVPAAELTPPPVPKRSVLRRAILPVTVAAAAAFVAATGYLVVTEPRPDPDMGRWGAVAAAPAPQTGPSWNPQATADIEPFGAVDPPPQGPPTRLRVTAIGIDTALESLHLGGNGALTPPRDFARAGWYADGTAPGDQGPAVIAAHVDSKRGPAVFYRLRELEAGDRIDVVRGSETVRFRVVSTAWYPKTTFPTDDVYGPTPDRQLRLITCGGVFDHRLRSYKDNLVVYAVAG
jgi:LPXTG-site transpeptidase (sortase) family protein